MTTLSIFDLMNRKRPPVPWEEADNIPWHEPEFSRRMLKEHLSQAHDAASRKFQKIDQHIAWISQELLLNQPARILDLACGPGLYSHRLARMGCQLIGIDYSPASIDYAREEAKRQGVSCQFLQADIREGDYGGPYDACMLIYGEFNVFRRQHIENILQKISAALEPGGLLLLEPHTFDSIQQMGQAAPLWYSAQNDVYSAAPHLVLEENFWEETMNIYSRRIYIIDSQTNEVIRFAQSMQAYSEEEYRQILEVNGFGDIHIFPSLTGIVDPEQSQLIAITARKQ